MPAACEPALKLAVQTRYLQGHKPKQIAKELGLNQDTIKTWAHRHGWKRAVDSVIVKGESVLGQRLKESSESVLAKHSEAVRNALAVDLRRVCDMVESAPSPSLSSALKRQQALVPVVANSKTVFGWSESTSTPAVRISILASAALVQVQEQAQPPALPLKVGEASFSLAQPPQEQVGEPLLGEGESFIQAS